jgi:hypothetical protein
MRTHRSYFAYFSEGEIMKRQYEIKKTPVTILAASIAFALQWSAFSSVAQTPPPATAEPSAEPTAAQQAEESEQLDRIEVIGIRQTQRTSSEVKRDSDTIVDALVSDEIGASPDLSVGETLERVTGVSADRFKGSASEISVRGRGPFLGFSTFNGREVSSGSGDRAVSFQQFPSDIVNGVVVYKSQRADMVEGGVSGVIDLQTIQPLDYGKKRVQIDLRGSVNEYESRIRDSDKISGSAARSRRSASGTPTSARSVPRSVIPASTPARPKTSTPPARAGALAIPLLSRPQCS